jgi:hypothetical protein
MHDHRQTSRRAALLGLLASICLLSGCAGAFRLYDESKAKMSAGAREEYAQANVLGVIEVEKNNLDNLLAEELKVVRDNHKLQVDFALLRIADDNKPMSDTYRIKAVNRLKELGYPGKFKQVREYLLTEVDIAAGRGALEEDAQLIENIAHSKPPACEAEALPSAMNFPAALDDAPRRRAESFYERYRKQCDELQKLGKQPLSGETRQALEAWRKAREERMQLNQTSGEAEKEAEKKRAAYDAAAKKLEDAKNSGPELSKALKDKAGLLAEDFKTAQSVAKFVGAEGDAKKRLDAIVVLLTAAAGGEIETSDQKLKVAAIVAKEIPSLAGDVKALIEQARAPTVSNLLIEMRHQVLLLEYAKQLRTLSQQRVDILKTQYDALKNEAEYWLNFGDAVCSYAIVVGSKNFPDGRTCDDFSVSDDGTLCRTAAGEVKNCILGRPWYEKIQQPGDPPAVRELYKALAAYLQALAIRATQHEQTFRLIDIRHRESLASRESALRGWDNLIAVPVNQIEAYYQAGLKPAEIADLIVKALGFTAITAGVSQ